MMYPTYMAEFRFHNGEFRWVMLAKDGPRKPWKVVISTAPAESRDHSAKNQAQVEWLADVNNGDARTPGQKRNPNFPVR